MDSMLELLQRVERGEISVEEAESRLAGAQGSGAVENHTAERTEPTARPAPTHADRGTGDIAAGWHMSAIDPSKRRALPLSPE
ncbi:MAG: hypothetical protein ABSC94_33300 [Polyangiaceae bacterium]|jgi:hypothetical protein